MQNTDQHQSPSVAEYLCLVLKHYRIETIFGLPGTTTLAALEAIRRQNSLNFITARHEQCAGHMADATARMGAPFGVLLVDLGPGLANTLTAILASQRDSVPLIVLAGNEERKLLGREVWHEMPELSIFEALTKGAYRLERSEDFPRLVRSALADMLTGRPGPVMLSVPKDLWDEYAGPESELLPPTFFAPAASELAVAAVARRIANAQRPIMLVGGQVRSTEACAALVAAAERWHCPVVTSPNGRGAISEDHALCLGHAGRFGQRQASQALQEADLVIALGCQVNDLTTHNWSLLSIQVPMVQVNQDGATIGRNWPAAEAIVADPGKFLSSLAGLVPSSDYLGNVWSVADKKRERQQARQTYYSIHDDEKVKPQSVMRELEKVLPDTHTIVMGGGRFQQFVGEWLVRSRKSFFYAANSGTVGYALSGSIGAALASPDRTVVCCLGDGDFMMHPQELETAVRSGIRLKIVVFNDFAFGAMKARQRIPYGTEYTNPDIALLASAFNVSGRTLVRGSETAEAVRWLIKQPKVAILDVQMDLKENRSLMYGHDIGDKV